jgi:ABC-type lipoprotein release transport system permease subunit
MIRDRFTMAYRNIRERKFCSFLTLLGISVGVAAITRLVAIGSGIEDTIRASFASGIHVRRCRRFFYLSQELGLMVKKRKG